MSEYDVVVIGAGPAGQKAAVQAAKAGKSVLIIDQDPYMGGACVHRGTIPSKTLRENALRVNHLRQNARLFEQPLPEETEMTVLFDRLDEVLAAHDLYMQKQMERNQIDRLHGRASFINAHQLEVVRVKGEPLTISGTHFVIATGSIPRQPADIKIDHEHIYDSDSVLSMLYLPRSLTVLGGGVIASEYASIFQALGVEVTMIDKYPRPLGFLDRDLTDQFVNAFQHMGGTWLGETDILEVYWDDASQVITELADGQTICSDKMLCAAGRIANIQGLNLDKAGLFLGEHGHIEVNEQLQTAVPHIYAAGDVIGYPALASASMEQGRRASCNALGIEINPHADLFPTGIYAIPELSSVGMSQQAAEERVGDVIVGRAGFDEIARGQISGELDGMLKLICDIHGEKILGVQIVGEGATELIHVGQMAMLADANVDIFVESIFNFPTLAEAYRVAALDVIGQRARRSNLY